MAKQHQYDVIVIGSGIAGMSYLTAIHKLNPTLRVALLTKNDIFDSNSYYAQGGIACVMGENSQDSLEQHVQDTIEAGAGLADVQVVRTIINHSQKSIQHLIEQGVQFDRSQKTFDLVREGGHSHARILHCQDTTGLGIMSALAAKVATFKNVDIFTNHIAQDFIVDNGEVVGVTVLANKEVTSFTLHAKVTVLATGGVGRLYQTTSNPQVTTGDGIAMAMRAGATVNNMAFVQFHPTIFYQGLNSQFLITEALRGEGAYLRCGEQLRRFMQDYDQERMELATRDVVAQAMFEQMRITHRDYVFLDMRHKGAAMLLAKFPKICSYLAEKGVHLPKDLIPVTPGAHYFCGGVQANHIGETNLARLYAIGEVACTGFHGANRLAGNSLLEGVHMGMQAAQNTAKWLQKPTRFVGEKSVETLKGERLPASELVQHWHSLRTTMQKSAGIVRSYDELLALKKRLHSQNSMLQKLKSVYVLTQPLIELDNAVQVASAIVHDAIVREQSVGCHLRRDNKREKYESSV